MTLAILLAIAAALALPANASAAPLPVISVEPERGITDDGVPAQVRAPGYSGPASIELRGNFTRTLPKKPYALELRDAEGENANAPLLGLPADDDWVLYAAYNDRTLMRNALAYEVSRSIGRYAPRTRFVELRIRGRSRGVYVLTEKLKLHPRRVRGAFLMEMTSPRQARDEDVAFRTPLLRRPFVFQDGDEDRARAVRAAVSRAERAIVAGGAGAWRRRLHGPSAVDHLLLTELFKNQDGMHASTYMHAPRPSAPLRLGPLWDLDIAMGSPGWVEGAHRPAGWMLAGRTWARHLYRDPAFHGAMQRRWSRLRRDGLRARVLRIADRYERRLSGAPVRLDLRLWPAGRPHRPRGGHAGHVRDLRRWLVRRIAWIDANLPRLR
jgi:CotH kinase protein